MVTKNDTNTVPPHPSYAERRPFEYAHPSCEELEPFLGKKWVIGRNTASLRLRYPNSRIVTRKHYAAAEAAAIEARGWARPVEKTIRELIDLVLIHNAQAVHGETIAAAREILKQARIP